MKFSIAYFVFLFLFVHAPLLCGATDSKSEANELLGKYEEYLKGLTNLRTASSAIISTTMPGEPPSTTKAKSIIYWSDRGVKAETTINSGDGGDRAEIQNETLISSKEYITSYHYVKEKEYSVSGFLKNFSDTPEERSKILYESLYFGYEFFESHSQSKPESLLSILRQSDLNISQNEGYFVLTAAGKNFKAQLWFAPDNQGAPSKIIYNRNPGAIPLYGMVSFVLDVNDFKKVSGISVPNRMSIQREKAVPKMSKPIDPMESASSEKIVQYDPTKDGKRIESIDITWEKTEFRELSDSVFQLQKLFVIPNGTSVSMQDVPQIQYIWYDGKVVPKTDELMLKIARAGHRFMPGPDEPRFWFMGIGIFLIVFAIGFKAYKKYKGIET